MTGRWQSLDGSHNHASSSGWQFLLLDAISIGRRNIANDLRGLGAKSHTNFAVDAKPTFSIALGVKRPVIRSMNVELFAAGRTVTWVDSNSPTSLT